MGEKYLPTRNSFTLLPKVNKGARDMFIHEELQWIDYLCPSEGFYEFIEYRQPIANFTALIGNKTFNFDKQNLSRYADLLGFDNPYVLDYKSYIPEIIDYENYYFPFPWEFRKIDLGENEEYYTEKQMRELILQKLFLLSHSNMNLAEEITEFYLETIEATKRILGIICPEWASEYPLCEIYLSERSFYEFKKKLSNKQASLKNVNIEFTQVDVETEEDRTNAAAKCRQLEILGLDETLKNAFKHADNPAASIADFLLSFKRIKPVTLKTQLNGTISNYSSSNSNSRNVSPNIIEKDFNYLRSVGVERSLISKYRNKYNL